MNRRSKRLPPPLIIHRAGYRDLGSNISPLCAKGETIDPRKAQHTEIDNKVTCAKCRRLLRNTGRVLPLLKSTGAW